MQLVFDALLLMPTNPTMLQARDALLAADLMRFGAANQKELWLGYARGGMGVGSSVTERERLRPGSGLRAGRDEAGDRQVRGQEH